MLLPNGNGRIYIFELKKKVLEFFRNYGTSQYDKYQKDGYPSGRYTIY